MDLLDRMVSRGRLHVAAKAAAFWSVMVLMARGAVQTGRGELRCRSRMARRTVRTVDIVVKRQRAVARGADRQPHGLYDIDRLERLCASRSMATRAVGCLGGFVVTTLALVGRYDRNASVASLRRMTR